jgi:type IV pilus assembly protein PilV
MNTININQQRFRVRGFTIIEVLIAVLVLSLGLLGLAGLQATSLKASTSAAARGQATLLAYDIIDRMRANRDVALAGTYDNTAGTAPTGAGTDCQAADCDEDAMAAYDLNQWKCLLGSWKSHATCTAMGITRGLLPDGDGEVEVTGNKVTVTVSWSETRWSDSNSDGTGERETSDLSLAVGTEL